VTGAAARFGVFAAGPPRAAKGNDGDSGRLGAKTPEIGHLEKRTGTWWPPPECFRARQSLCETVCSLKSTAFLIALALLPSALEAAGPRRILVNDVTVIDGMGGSSLPHRDVRIEGSRIAGIAPAGAVAPKPGTEVLDGRGKFLLPGLTDMHAHVTYLEWTTDAEGRPKAVYDRAATEKTLKLLLAFGVTTARNPAAPAEEGVQLREDVAKDLVVGPRIFTAGDILNRAGYFDGLTRPVRYVEDVRREIARQAKIGVDYIKLYAGLDPPLVAAGVAEAHARGLKVLGHLQATSWREAADFGIDGLCHGASWSAEELPPERRESYRRAVSSRGPMKARLDWLDAVEPHGRVISGMIQSLVRMGVAVDPTLIAYESKFKGDEPKYTESPDLDLAPAPMRASFPRISFVRDWTAEDFRRGRVLWGKMLTLVRVYAERGVLLTIGSDEPNAWLVPGASLHSEMALLVDAGIPAREVLKMATGNAAKALGQSSQSGTIEAGKRADLVLLAANPTENIANTRKIEWVMKGGVRYDPEKLLVEAR
jgi:imidazolonepropionase-like amidohydrolase